MSALDRMRGHRDARSEAWKAAGRGQGARRGALALAVVLAVAGLTGMLRTGSDQRAADPGVPTVVVDGAVAQGSAGDELVGMLEVRDVPLRARPDDALGSLAEVGRAPAGRDLAPGQVLRRADLATGEDAPRRGVAGSSVEPGSVELSVALPVDRALGGKVAKGSLVLVVGTGTGETAPARVLAGPLTVTSVDEDAEGSGSSGRVVTLAVPQKDLAVVVPALAAEGVWLAGVPR